MNELKEPLISKAIVDSYHRKLRRAIESDVVIIGAGQFKTFIEKQYGLPVVVGTHPHSTEILADPRSAPLLGTSEQ